MGKIQYAIIAVLVGMGLLGVSINKYTELKAKEDARLLYEECVITLKQLNKELSLYVKGDYRQQTGEQRAIAYGKLKKGIYPEFENISKNHYLIYDSICGDDLETQSK